MTDEFTTKRPTSPGLEKWFGKEIPVLDKGFVRLVDYMGGDESIVQAARVSYGKGTKKTSEDRGLIRYLMRHRHTTPFEMCEIKLHCKMPIFVAREWVRHRTASINEYSARYSEMPNEYYTPKHEHITGQDPRNRQSRGVPLDADTQEQAQALMGLHTERCHGAYTQLLQHGVARELSRSVLPVSGYTQWYWKMDLHNLLHFLSLRMGEGAQFEIREYANAIGQIVKDWVPMVWEAFLDYRKASVALSRGEKCATTDLLAAGGVKAISTSLMNEAYGLSKREAMEYAERFGLELTD
jgi:thymidylate synthase (FAD)